MAEYIRVLEILRVDTSELGTSQKYFIYGSVPLITIWTFHKAHNFIKNYQERLRFTSLRKRKQGERKAHFNQLSSEFSMKTEGFKEIVDLPFKELQKKLQSRELKAQSVLSAFIAKSLEVQEQFNCITEYIPSAMEKAKALDRLEKPKGLLHGIPFSVKDDTGVEGMDSTNGCSRLLYKEAKESAVIVQTLENLGAIPFCKTNVPQTCLSGGSDNPIFGQTSNPLNKKLGPGGSSSGSSCLVAAGGTPFGTGSDSGGSLRIPAHCTGISTLKTTHNRISDVGCLHCSPILTTVPGILVKRAEDLSTIYKAMIMNHFENPLDETVPPIQWNSKEFESTERLRIGYFTSLEIFPPIGDTQTVVLEAKEFLEREGHELVPFELPKYHRMWTSVLLNPGMGKSFMELTKNDEIGYCVRRLSVLFWMFPLYQAIFRFYVKVSNLLGLRIPNLGKNLQLPLDYLKEEEALRAAILDEMKRSKVDLLLSPAFPFPAIRLKQMSDVCIQKEYTTVYNFIWNLVNFPAGVVRFGKECGENWELTKTFDKQTRDESVNMPIAVQIVGKPYKEEQVLRILTLLDTKNNPSQKS